MIKRNGFFGFFLLLASACLSCSQPISTVQVNSPDGRISFAVEVNEATGHLFYSVTVNGRTITQNSQLAMDTNVGPFSSFTILSVQESSTDEEWTPVYGERNKIPNRFSSITAKLRTTKEPYRFVNLNCRAYNEGVAFRFEFPEQENLDNLVIESELTEFAFLENHQVWATDRAQAEYRKVLLSQVNDGCERPLVLEIESTLYAAIGEAGLVDYARMKFNPHPDKNLTLISSLASKVKVLLPFTTPWRFLMIGDSPGRLLENNYFILNLNEPNEIKDTSWIKPGKVIREVTLTTQGGKSCVDFATAHNLQYVEFDAGWYGYEHDEKADATTVSVDPNRSPGPLDLYEVFRYAKEREIGIILYVNRRSLERQIDDVLPLFEQWGVAGLKYGFVQVGSQEWTAWLHEAVRKAAHHNLMVDIHDEYRPTGYSRTFPNLMTQEGIRGDEESPPNEHTLITMFTRMIAGAGDNTICYFAKRVDEKMGSHASQLAKAVCLYSPWQFLYWYDRPPGSPGGKGAGNVEISISNEPELEFFDQVPTVWDETKVIEAEIGKYGTIARRSGDEWFIGSINGVNKRTFTFTLDFLKPNQDYVASIYSDDSRMKTRTRVRCDRYLVTCQTQIQEEVLENNGMAFWIQPTNDTDSFSAADSAVTVYDRGQ